MRKMTRFASAVAALMLLAVPALAQQPVFIPANLQSVAGLSTSVTAGSVCALIKYVGTTVGKPAVEVQSDGDLELTIAASADTTTGSPNLDGEYDLSTPAAAVDTYGELVNLVNTTGSNWKMVLVSCLATDLTNNTLFTLAVTDAAGPKGVALYRDSTVASATSVFSSQIAAVPDDAAVNMQFWLNSGAPGYPATGKKINANPFANWQAFIQYARENITSSGTVALEEVLAVKRLYDGNGKVSEQVRTLWSETGAATTVEDSNQFHAGPIAAAPGEMIIYRQRTGTALTVESIGVGGYMVHK